MKARTIEIIIGIILLVMVLLALTICISVMWNKQVSVFEAYCEDTGGKYYFYECANMPFAEPPCSELKTGWWCEYPDGTNLSRGDLERRFNSTI